MDTEDVDTEDVDTEDVDTEDVDNVFFTIGHQKKDLSAPLPGNCSELRCASFSKKCKF